LSQNPSGVRAIAFVAITILSRMPAKALPSFASLSE
jgi:hypothetical protein